MRALTIACLLGTLFLVFCSQSVFIGQNLLPVAELKAVTTYLHAPVTRELEAAAAWIGGAPSLGEAVADDELSDGPKDPGTLTMLERARAALAQSNAPTLSRHEICTTLVGVAQANALPLGFFAKLIWRESQFDHTAISRVGAMGIAQFMPAVADKLGLDAFDARDALPASGQLLRTLRARFGNLGLVAAAYNAGPKRVSDWLQQRSELPKETRDYVSIVTGRPVEQWRTAKPETVAFKVPRYIPCHRTAEFSLVEQTEYAEQSRKIAEEQNLREKILQAARRTKPKMRTADRPSRKTKLAGL